MTFLSSDSVFKLKSSKANRTIEDDLRKAISSKKWDFMQWKESGHMLFGTQFDQIDFHIPYVTTVMLKDIVEENLVRTQEVMAKHLDKSSGKTPQESPLRPRIPILFWTVNDWWPANTPMPLDKNAECFVRMREWSQNLLRMHDRVAICIVGSATVWELDPMWDKWRDHAFRCVQANGIVT